MGTRFEFEEIAMKLVTFLLYCAPMVAQTQVAISPETSANLPAQILGPRDLIVLQVYDSPELSRTIRVDSDGLIRLPMLKQPIKAEGLMPDGLEAVVARAFEEGGVL